MIGLHEQLEAALAGRYQIERELGQGGMAIVYLARDLKHARRVAVKLLRPELTTSLATERFLLEINVAAALSHPHILPLFDSGEADELLYYVMPYVEGESLRQRLERERQLPLDEALSVTRQVASALDYAHAHGVVHRDVKPENILLQGDHVVVADFGLARALYSAASPRLTRSGTAVGTPAYMSPEQGSGDRQVDGRADVYSLACVVFEMIAGVPPFRGANAQTVIAHHVSTPPPSLCVERSSCPPAFDVAVQRALAKIPADRFRKAGDLARALDAAVGAGALPAPVAAVAPRRRGWRGVTAPVSALGVAVVLGAAYLVLGTGYGDADNAQIAVLPFAVRAAAGPGNAEIGRAYERVSDALGEWHGIRLVDPQRVREAVEERGAKALRTADALRVARTLDAGRLVWGDVAATGDSVVVRATLYDARRGSEIRRYVIRYAPANAGATVQQFRELASALLRGRTELPWSGADDRRPASLPAWLAYDAGRRAAAAWDLSAAQGHFRRAVDMDGDHAQAHLWLAQVLTWREDQWSHETDGGMAELRRMSSRRAAESGGRLRPRDAAIARGLLALAEARHPEACSAFRDVIATAPKDFAGWYGLGDCQSRDSVVIVDRRSASGYRFRSSFRSAVASYIRATESAPPPHPSFPYIRLKDILIAETNRVRFGRSIGQRDSLRFAALPSLDADTLAHVPYPVSAFSLGRAGTYPATHDDALAANRSRLREVLSLWVSTAPQSAAAHEMLADLLETAGNITEAEGQHSALTAVRRARELAADSVATLRLARSELRLLMKSEDFAGAKRLADSLLAARRRTRTADAAHLVGAAAITGRLHRTEELVASTVSGGFDVPTLPDGRPLQIPAGLLKEWASVLAHASLGACTAPLRGFERRMSRLLESYVVDPDERAATIDALLERPVSLAVPCLGPNAATRIGSSRDRLVRMQQMLARRDTAALRAQFDTLRLLRAQRRPGEISIDHIYMEAWLLAAIGDTAAAVRRLDLALDAPALLGTLLYDAPHSGGFLRAMALRAELGARTGDMVAARRWGGAVATMWADADRELQPVVTRMREISRREARDRTAQ